MELCIFDLDGVICDTAKYHFLAWKALADDLGIAFDGKDNERLKGISRMDSLNILLSKGKQIYTQEEKEEMAERKNEQYLVFTDRLTKQDILPGVCEFLQSCKQYGCKVALGSASKNSQRILKRLGLREQFDFIVDGTQVTAAKPDPEVFLKSMEYYHLKPYNCIVFEDAAAGIQAAQNAGMFSVGIGSPEQLGAANIVIHGFNNITFTELLICIKKDIGGNKSEKNFFTHLDCTCAGAHRWELKND